MVGLKWLTSEGVLMMELRMSELKVWTGWINCEGIMEVV